MANAKTETKQAEMKLKHCKEELKKKQQEMKQVESLIARDKGLIDHLEKDVKNIEVNLNIFVDENLYINK